MCPRDGVHLYILNYSIDMTQFIKGFRFQYGLRERHSFSSNGHVNASDLKVGAVYIIPRNPTMHPLVRGTYLRTDLAYSTRVGSFEEWRFQYIKQFSARFKAQGLASFDLLRDSKYFEVGISWDLDAFRTTTSVRTIRSTPSFIQTARGSMGWDRNTNSLLFDNRQQVGRAGVTVRMFVDDDNSGIFDEGEELLPGNALTIERSSSRQVTQNGITRMTQLQPYRRYNFRVNEARVDNPMLVASHKKFSIITDPNQYKQLDVPFYTTGVIDGRVDKRKDGELVPLSGLRIHIRAIDGNFEKTVRTFGDGSFYSMEVPPGRYELSVDDAQLVFLRAVSIPAVQSFSIQPSAEGDYVEGLDFILE
ncbi:MAG: carboxypeptidase-like regulatory domain-containing protein [Candidatus Marinimicrobia bacterium]|nr:carboxypeptidase-like regulatory domain-containing protein [Candidatus Neomarinimicrobiota bacterium]MCF7905447.1 carboxypeptidase-like regulatory domain-containing protein [Candidatus Neomarinimicrobiota bacterium]